MSSWRGPSPTTPASVSVCPCSQPLVSQAQGEAKGQLCGPHWVCLSPAHRAAPSSAWARICPAWPFFLPPLCECPPRCLFSQAPGTLLNSRNEQSGQPYPVPTCHPLPPQYSKVPETFPVLLWEPEKSPTSACFQSLLSPAEAIAAKMRFHSQLFSRDQADSALPVMEHQVRPPLLHLS